MGDEKSMDNSSAQLRYKSIKPSDCYFPLCRTTNNLNYGASDFAESHTLHSPGYAIRLITYLVNGPIEQSFKCILHCFRSFVGLCVWCCCSLCISLLAVVNVAFAKNLCVHFTSSYAFYATESSRNQMEKEKDMSYNGKTHWVDFRGKNSLNC